MSFITDKQTLDDLNIFGKRGNHSIYNLFNHTSTRGGGELLEQWFRYPLSDQQAINRRSSHIRYFQSLNSSFPFGADLFDSAEQYLRHSKGEPEYQLITKGVAASIRILQEFRQFLSRLAGLPETPYGQEAAEINALLDDPALAPVISQPVKEKLNYSQTADYDRLLRSEKPALMRSILVHVYQLDVYTAVAKVADREGLVFPVALPADEQRILFKGVYHPLVKNAIGNDLEIAASGNVVFLTGANMAGKSTLMKSLGIAVFLAHMGFPVAATQMEFAVRDGLYTTINLDDNLNMGYSHFYTEVMRVKKVAQELGNNKNIFVIFDELFRGTNVKDAYDATVAITAAFSDCRNSMFVVSTHIMEAGDQLRNEFPTIQFTYLPTVMEGFVPVYPRVLKTGITADRHGMVIINNEGILDILKNGIR